MNSFPNKFYDLKVFLTSMLDILILRETKMKNSLPLSQLHRGWFCEPYILGRNRNGGGIIIYVTEDIPSRMLTIQSYPGDTEGLFAKLNCRKSK